MGLPKINIEFIKKAQSAVKRSARGIVACIIKDDAEDAQLLQVCKSINDIDFTKFSETNHDYLKLIFAANPSSVIIVRQKTEAVGYTDSLQLLVNQRWNYLTIPGITTSETTTIVAWIKEQRENHKTFKVVLPKTEADHIGIINSCIDNVETTIIDKKVDAATYCARVAGILAAVPLSQSTTYFVLSDISYADVPKNPDEAIEKGQFIVVFDGEKYKVGRGVNSLTTIPAESDGSWQKIKIVEGMDLIQDDIKDAFEETYTGKVRNSYDKKQEFVASINNYFRTIEGEILDENEQNVCTIDYDKQKKYLEDQGVDTSKMSEVEILEANTGSHVFIRSSLRLVDAMEDLDLINYL